MKTINLQVIWTELCSTYTKDTDLIGKCWKEIAGYYTLKGRYYHGLNHIRDLVCKVDAHQNLVEDMPSMLFAIFYHDIIYKPTRSDNEDQSAKLAASRLVSLAVPPKSVEKVQGHILATKSHEMSDVPDTNVLLDLDLSVLGADADTYQLYSINIRKEYVVYPNFIYKRGRRKVVQHFLSMDRIFINDVFYDLYERQARRNLQQELKSL